MNKAFDEKKKRKKNSILLFNITLSDFVITIEFRHQDRKINQMGEIDGYPSIAGK